MNSEANLFAAQRECKRLKRQNDYLRDCVRRHCEEIQRLEEELKKNEEALVERDEVYRRLREITGLLHSDFDAPRSQFGRLN